jgi:adenosylcobinamide-GDP ribazoletransferase
MPQTEPESFVVTHQHGFINTELHAFGNAVMFFTRLRVPKRLRWSESLMEKSAGWYPTVGLVVGAFGALTALGANEVWGPVVAAPLSLIVTLLVTGAFHEDGLADMCDAFFGSYDRTRVLEIMKDSRIGSFGGAGLFVVMATKVAFTALALSGHHALGLVERWGNPAWVLIIAHGLSRAGSVTMLRLLPYVRENDDVGAKSKPMAKRITTPRLIWAWITSLILVVALVDVTQVVLLIGASLLTVGVLARWFHRRIGGYTGDCLGATQQLVELVALAVLTA